MVMHSYSYAHTSQEITSLPHSEASEPCAGASLKHPPPEPPQSSHPASVSWHWFWP